MLKKEFLNTIKDKTRYICTFTVSGIFLIASVLGLVQLNTFEVSAQSTTPEIFAVCRSELRGPDNDQYRVVFGTRNFTGQNYTGESQVINGTPIINQNFDDDNLNNFFQGVNDKALIIEYNINQSPIWTFNTSEFSVQGSLTGQEPSCQNRTNFQIQSYTQAVSGSIENQSNIVTRNLVIIPNPTFTSFEANAQISRSGLLGAGGSVLQITDKYLLISPGVINQEVINNINNLESVAFAEYDRIRTPTIVRSNEALALSNSNNWYADEINLDLAKNLAGNQTANVTILGAQFTNNEGFFDPTKVVNGFNSFSNIFEAGVFDQSAAGDSTTIAGLINSQVTQNGTINGICTECTITPIRAAGGSGFAAFGGASTASSISNGLNHAIKFKPAVVNLALQADYLSFFEYITLQRLAESNISIVTNLDNSGILKQNSYSLLPNVITVAGSNRAGGSSIQSSYHPTADLSAPSEAILVLGSAPAGNGNGLASAQVAGTIALMKATNPNLEIAQIKNLLKITTSPFREGILTQRESRVGTGILNSGEVLRKVICNAAGDIDEADCVSPATINSFNLSTTQAEINDAISFDFEVSDQQSYPTKVELFSQNNPNEPIATFDNLQRQNPFRGSQTISFSEDGNYGLFIKVTDTENNIINSEVLNLIILLSNQAPVIDSLTSNSSEVLANSNFSLNLQGTDDNGIREIRIARNGQLVRTIDGANRRDFTETINLNAGNVLRPFNYTVTVIDNQGLETSSVLSIATYRPSPMRAFPPIIAGNINTANFRIRLRNPDQISNTRIEIRERNILIQSCNRDYTNTINVFVVCRFTSRNRSFVKNVRVIATDRRGNETVFNYRFRPLRNGRYSNPILIP
jgi:hypothetical protein